MSRERGNDSAARQTTFRVKVSCRIGPGGALLPQIVMQFKDSTLKVHNLTRYQKSRDGEIQQMRQDNS
jgi:hypothetical protein